jgi:hypothetical protein
MALFYLVINLQQVSSQNDFWPKFLTPASHCACGLAPAVKCLQSAATTRLFTFGAIKASACPMGWKYGRESD